MNIKTAFHALNSISPLAVNETLDLKYITNRYRTRAASLKLLKIPRIKTSKFGIKSIKYQVTANWNLLQNHFKELDLSSLRPSKIDKLVTEYINNETNM